MNGILEEVSDEVGEEENGDYILCYEGWSGICVSKVFDPLKSDEENEDAFYEFAEEQSGRVIEEWVVKNKDYQLIQCGHERGLGLYGVTWALFKRDKVDDQC
ncbi:hypothetical protein DRO59_06130 [Candidatus Bathyarchaeota archaeon]|nr:MAG: hypothetical protein DRO59_06130 [Candidatus Bathyarchaeota archaeon]